MKLHTFIADSAADAVAQIRAQLGPEAVVLNVRQPPVEGFARLWQKPRIEVLACVPEPAPPAAPPSPPPPPPPKAGDAVSSSDLLELRRQISVIEQQVLKARPAREEPVPQIHAPPPEFTRSPFPGRESSPAAGTWRVGPFLENTGVLPVHAHRVVEQLRTHYGDTPPAGGLARELELARGVLADCWQKPPARQPSGLATHVLIGPPGVGKTTTLCKWLAQTVLLENRRAAVWRLDGRTANTAEMLSVYCDILGVEAGRCLPELGGVPDADVLFVDLPGVNGSDAPALQDLGERIRALPAPEVHLVLNGAYETGLLLSQARAFSCLPVTDLVVTHLDEETRWGKLWNLVLGTKFPLRFLGAGQNIPGDLMVAEPGRLLDRQMR